MNNITNNKRAISVIVILALVLVLVGVVNHNDSKSDKKEAVVASTENTSLYAGMLADMSKNDALTAGIVYEAENSSAATAEDNSDVLVGATLANIDEYPEGTTYGYTNIGFAQVEDGNLNVRKSAAADGAIVGKLTNNNAVEVISTSEDGQWLEITSGNVEGFVKAEYIVTGEEALALVPELIRTYAVVEADVLRVRAEPNTDSKTLETVNDSDGLVATAILDGWIEVEMDDSVGYVCADYIKLTNKFAVGQTLRELRRSNGVSDTRIDLCNYALQFVGNRYVWGGTSLTHGVDCSGFTMQVYAHFGISLPHSSRAQPGYGVKINAADAKPGDLFFYGSGGSIGHVAIYIGNGQIVHASNARDGIKISNAYYRTPICVVSYLN